MYTLASQTACPELWSTCTCGRLSLIVQYGAPPNAESDVTVGSVEEDYR